MLDFTIRICSTPTFLFFNLYLNTAYIRSTLHLSYYIHIHITESWKNLESQRKFHKAVMVYKSINGLAPNYLSSMFLDRDSVTNYPLRDTEGKLAIPMPHTNFLKNSFGYSGVVLWNSLPIEVRQVDTLGEFRSGCSSFLNF